MVVAVRWYPNGQLNFLAGSIDWDANDIRVMLLNASGTFNDAHDFVDDVVANEITGTGYTAGGTALGTKTNVVTDSSALTAWAATTAYLVGDVVRAVADNGHVFRCTVAGTSGGTEPAWNTGTLRETADGATLKWVEFGAAVVRLGAANVSWTSATFTTNFGVIHNRTPGTDATRQLIAHLDFDGAKSPSNGTFQITWSALGILRAGLGSP